MGRESERGQLMRRMVLKKRNAIALFVLLVGVAIVLSFSSAYAASETIDLTNISAGEVLEHTCGDYLYTNHNTIHHWQECSVCHKIYSVAAHAYVDAGWTRGSSNYCNNDNVHKYICSCGYSYFNTDGKKAHNYRMQYQNERSHREWCSSCDELSSNSTGYRHYNASGTLGCDTGLAGNCAGCGQYVGNHHSCATHWTFQGTTNSKCNVCGREFLTNGGQIITYSVYDASQGLYILQATQTTNFSLSNVTQLGSGCNFQNTNFGEVVSSSYYFYNATTILYTIIFKYKGYCESELPIYYSVNLKSGNDVINLYNYFHAIYDRTPPTITTINSANQSNNSNWAINTNVVINGTENYCSSIRLSLTDNYGITYLNNVYVSVINNNWSYSIVPNIDIDANGRIFTVTAVDNVGNTTQKTFNLYKLDKTPPILTSPRETSRGWSKNKLYTISTQDTGVGGVTIKFNSSNQYKTTTPNGVSYSKEYNFIGDVYGAVTPTLYFKDALGNISTDYMSVYYLDNTAPTIESVTKNGTSVTMKVNDKNGRLGKDGSGATPDGYGNYGYYYGYSDTADGAITWTALSTENTKTFTVSSTAKYIWVKDYVGNVTYAIINSLVYNANGGTGVPATQYDVVVFPNTQSTFTVSTTKPTRPGYTFDGWYTAATGGTKVGTTYTVGSNNQTKNQSATLYAHWTPNTYTISYSLNGGSFGTYHPTSATYDSAFTVSNPTRTGYTFSGWKITDMDSVTHTYGSSTTTSTSISSTKATSFKNLRSTSGTVTFTAQWTANPYLQEIYVRYEDEKGNWGSYVCEYSKYHNFDSTVPEWKKTATQAWQEVKVPSYKVVWTDTNRIYVNCYRQQYKVDLNCYADNESRGNTDGIATCDIYINGSKVSTGATDFYQDVRYGSTYEIKNIVTSGNWIFDGRIPWQTQYSNLTGTVTGGTSITPYFWTTWKVSFDTNKDMYEKMNDIPSNVGEVTNVYLHTNNRDVSVSSLRGWTFLGWYDAKTGGTRVYSESGEYDSSATAYWNSSGQWVKKSNVALYAHWKPNNYTVSFDTNRDSYPVMLGAPSAVSPVTMTYDSTANNQVPTSSVEGWKFLGWYDAKVGGVQVYDESGKFNASATGYWNSNQSVNGNWIKPDNVTLYAHWEDTITAITVEETSFTSVYPTPVTSYPLGRKASTNVRWEYQWLNKNVPLRFSASDTGSGIESLKLYREGDMVNPVAIGSVSSGTYKATLSYEVPEDGVHTYYLITRDRSGNTFTITIITRKDATKPVIVDRTDYATGEGGQKTLHVEGSTSLSNISQDSTWMWDWHTKENTIFLQASDATVGMKSFTLYRTNSSWENYSVVSEGSSSNGWEVSGTLQEGRNYFVAEAIDLVGNKLTYMINLKWDATNPDITKSFYSQPELSDFTEAELGFSNGSFGSGCDLRTHFEVTLDEQKTDSSGIKEVILSIWDAEKEKEKTLKTYQMELKESIENTEEGRIKKATYFMKLNLYELFPESSLLYFEIKGMDHVLLSDEDIPQSEKVDDDGIYKNFSVKLVAKSLVNSGFDIDPDNGVTLMKPGEYGYLDIWTIGNVNSVALDFGSGMRDVGGDVPNLGEEMKSEIERNLVEADRKLGMFNEYAIETIPLEQRRVLSYTTCEEYDSSTGKIPFIQNYRKPLFLGEGTKFQIPPYYPLKEEGIDPNTNLPIYRWEILPISVIAEKNLGSISCYKRTTNYITLWSDVQDDLHYRVN